MQSHSLRAVIYGDSQSGKKSLRQRLQSKILRIIFVESQLVVSILQSAWLRNLDNKGIMTVEDKTINVIYEYEMQLNRFEYIFLPLIIHSFKINVQHVYNHSLITKKARSEYDLLDLLS